MTKKQATIKFEWYVAQKIIYISYIAQKIFYISYIAHIHIYASLARCALKTPWQLCSQDALAIALSRLASSTSVAAYQLPLEMASSCLGNFWTALRDIQNINMSFQKRNDKLETTNLEVSKHAAPRDALWAGSLMSRLCGRAFGSWLRPQGCGPVAKNCAVRCRAQTFIIIFFAGRPPQNKSRRFQRRLPGL